MRRAGQLGRSLSSPSIPRVAGGAGLGAPPPTSSRGVLDVCGIAGLNVEHETEEAGTRQVPVLSHWGLAWTRGPGQADLLGCCCDIQVRGRCLTQGVAQRTSPPFPPPSSTSSHLCPLSRARAPPCSAQPRRSAALPSPAPSAQKLPSPRSPAYPDGQKPQSSGQPLLPHPLPHAPWMELVPCLPPSP